MYSGLTRTMVLRYLNRMLGTTVQELEITEEEMMRVVFQESLITFSKYFPYKYRTMITRKDALDPKYPNIYTIPNDDRLQIIGVHNIWIDNMNQFGGSLLPVVAEPFAMQELNDLLSATVARPTFEFRAPNLLTIRPKLINNDGAMVELKAVHPEHMKTIPLNMRDEFLRLCLDDVLLSLYPIRHRFENYTTVYGQLTPFFEMVDGAKADKEELLNRWQENLLRDSSAKRVWIA